MWTWEFFEDAKTSGKKKRFLVVSMFFRLPGISRWQGWFRVRKRGIVGSWNELGHGGSYLGWTKTNGHQLPGTSGPWNSQLFSNIFTNSIGCRYQLVCFQIRNTCLKKHFSRFAPSIFRASWKKCPHFHPFPQQPRPPSRCIVANKCTASVHIIAAPQDDMARWYATLSGMRSRPGCVTKTCPMMVFFGLAHKKLMVPMHSHLCIYIYRVR